MLAALFALHWVISPFLLATAPRTSRSAGPVASACRVAATTSDQTLNHIDQVCNNELTDALENRYGYSKQYLKGRIIGALGGRAAEEVVFGDETTGAESDLDQVSN